MTYTSEGSGAYRDAAITSSLVCAHTNAPHLTLNIKDNAHLSNEARSNATPKTRHTLRSGQIASIHKVHLLETHLSTQPRTTVSVQTEAQSAVSKFSKLFPRHSGGKARYGTFASPQREAREEGVACDFEEACLGVGADVSVDGFSAATVVRVLVHVCLLVVYVLAAFLLREAVVAQCLFGAFCSAVVLRRRKRDSNDSEQAVFPFSPSASSPTATHLLVR